jgi:hypothetical protein
LIRVPKEIKEKIIFFSAYAGILKAIWYGFYEILTTMISHIESMPIGENMKIRAFTTELKKCL